MSFWGLGLAVVNKIVKEHKGRIWLGSQMGEGATFFVALPSIKLTGDQQ